MDHVFVHNVNVLGCLDEKNKFIWLVELKTYLLSVDGKINTMIRQGIVGVLFFIFRDSWELLYSSFTLYCQQHFLVKRWFKPLMQESVGDFLFFFFFSSLLKGGASHKKIDLSGNFFLRIYYHSRVMQTVVEHRLTNCLPLSLQLTVRQTQLML